MSGRPESGGVRTVPDTWMRDVDKAISSLEHTTSQMLALVTEAVARWCGTTDRFEALLERILEAERHATTDDPPSAPCDR